MRIYVAGAISSDNILGCLTNIREGIKACAKLLKLGHEPFCSHLDYQFHFFEDLSIDDYYRYSIKWLEVSDLVLVLPNSEDSRGTIVEINRAIELDIKVMDYVEFIGGLD